MARSFVDQLPPRTVPHRLLRALSRAPERVAPSVAFALAIVSLHTTGGVGPWLQGAALLALAVVPIARMRCRAWLASAPIRRGVIRAVEAKRHPYRCFSGRALPGLQWTAERLRQHLGLNEPADA